MGGGRDQARGAMCGGRRFGAPLGMSGHALQETHRALDGGGAENAIEHRHFDHACEIALQVPGVGEAGVVLSARLHDQSGLTDAADLAAQLMRKAAVRGLGVEGLREAGRAPGNQPRSPSSGPKRAVACTVSGWRAASSRLRTAPFENPPTMTVSHLLAQVVEGILRARIPILPARRVVADRCDEVRRVHDVPGAREAIRDRSRLRGRAARAMNEENADVTAGTA